MLPQEVAALAAVRAVYAEPVVYTGAGLAGATILAIPGDDQAGSFTGAGDVLRTVWFEVEQALLPEQPRKGNQLIHGGVIWTVQQIAPRDDIGAYILTVMRS